MTKTQRLFDINSKTCDFDAVVLSCEAREGSKFDVVLDKTAFFPNEGGQACDTGVLGGVPVLSVNERGGVIIHTVDAPLTVGEVVHGEIDAEPRFRKMQNHTGEHIISGLVFTL